MGFGFQKVSIPIIMAIISISQLLLTNMMQSGSQKKVEKKR